MPRQIPKQKTPTANTAGEIDQTVLSSELFNAMVYLNGEDEFQRFMIDLCTPAELRALAGRWYVARALDDGDSSYRELNAETGISTTTIGRVSRFLNEEPHQGYRLVLERMKTEEQN